ncbi:MAG: glycosyltransferase family 87 protein, partial [Candidatus Aminicenantales bacterium]
WPVFWTVIVLLKYLGREFQLGQVNLLVLFLMALVVREWTRGRGGRAGIFWGLSLLFKPYAAIFLPYFIVKKKWATAAAGAGTLLAGLLLPIVRFGEAGNRFVLGEWVRSLSASTPGLLRVGDNASIYAFAAKTFGLSSNRDAMIVGGLAAAVLAALVLWIIILGRKAGLAGTEPLEASVLIMLIPLLSPLGWNYNYLYGLPAVFILCKVYDSFTPWEKGLLIADFILIGGTIREVLGKAAFRFYTGQALVVPCFLFLFALLIQIRRRRLA